MRCLPFPPIPVKIKAKTEVMHMNLSRRDIPPEYLAILQKFRFIDDTFFAACLDGDIPCMNLIG